MKLIYVLLVLSFICVASVFGGKKELAESLQAAAKKHAEKGEHGKAAKLYSKAAMLYYTEGEFDKFSSMKKKEAKHHEAIADDCTKSGNSLDANTHFDRSYAASAASKYCADNSNTWSLLSCYANGAEVHFAAGEYREAIIMKNMEAMLHTTIANGFAESGNSWYAGYHRTKASEALAAAENYCKIVSSKAEDMYVMAAKAYAAQAEYEQDLYEPS